jgi:hypothetical protein
MSFGGLGIEVPEQLRGGFSRAVFRDIPFDLTEIPKTI